MTDLERTLLNRVASLEALLNGVECEESQESKIFADVKKQIKELVRRSGSSLRSIVKKHPKNMTPAELKASIAINREKLRLFTHLPDKHPAVSRITRRLLILQEHMWNRGQKARGRYIAAAEKAYGDGYW